MKPKPINKFRVHIKLPAKGADRFPRVKQVLSFGVDATDAESKVKALPEYSKWSVVLTEQLSNYV